MWEREVCVIVIPLNAQQGRVERGKGPPSLGETAAEWEKGGSLAASLRSERERRRAACGASFSEAVFLFSPLGFSSFPRCCFGKTAKRRENWRGKVFPLPPFTYLVPALGGILFTVLFFLPPLLLSDSAAYSSQSSSSSFTCLFLTRLNPSTPFSFNIGSRKKGKNTPTFSNSVPLPHSLYFVKLN